VPKKVKGMVGEREREILYAIRIWLRGKCRKSSKVSLFA